MGVALTFITRSPLICAEETIDVPSPEFRRLDMSRNQSPIYVVSIYRRDSTCAFPPQSAALAVRRPDLLPKPRSALCQSTSRASRTQIACPCPNSQQLAMLLSYRPCNRDSLKNRS